MGELDCFAEGKCSSVEGVTPTGSIVLKGSDVAFHKFLTCASDHNAGSLHHKMKTCSSE